MPSLSEIARLVGAPESDSDAIDITGVATLEEAERGDLSFVGAESYLPQLARTQAAAVIVQKRLKVPDSWSRPALSVDDADLALAKVLQLFAPPVPRPPLGVDSM